MCKSLTRGVLGLPAVNWVAGIALGAAISVSAIGFATYPGSGFVFVSFNLSFFGLAILIFPQPRLYVYTFLAAFLALGFWAKTLIHTIWATGFLEPVGDFADTAEEWDRALIAASCAALAVIAVRSGHLAYWWTRQCGGEPANGRAPDWFVRWRCPVWISSIVLVIAVNAANLHFAFFQIGMNPKLILPMRGNVLLAWLVNIGFALWVAAVLWWDHKNERQALGPNLIASMLEAFFSSVSTFSRIVYPLHAGPYWLAIWERRKELADVMRGRRLVVLISWFMLFFAASIVTVFGLRIIHYTSGSMTMRSSMTYELPKLFIQRWVGLEGLLTAGATPNRGRELLIAAIKDDPKQGVRSLFQGLAKVKSSVDPAKFTFLTNAGPVAILLLSGSFMVVFLGMALIAAILILTEDINRKWTGNPLLLTVSGAGLANVICQTTFPYLTAIFLLQMWVAIGFLAAIERLRVGKMQARELPGSSKVQ